MKTIKYILYIMTVLLLLPGSGAKAQSGNEFFLSYNFGVPLANSKEYVPTVSYIGAEINYKYFLKKNISLSLLASWNIFYKETTELLSLPNADVSGLQNRYINTVPLLAGVQYYFGKDNNNMRPYAGINAGALYLTRRLQIGVYDLTESSWHFMVQPEIGILLEIDRYSDLMFGVTYNYGTPTKSDITGKDVTESWIGIKLGYGWKAPF